MLPRWQSEGQVRRARRFHRRRSLAKVEQSGMTKQTRRKTRLFDFVRRSCGEAATLSTSLSLFLSRSSVSICLDNACLLKFLLSD